MNNYLLLLKTYFKQTFRTDMDKKEKRKKYLIYGSVAIAALPLLILICYLVYNLGIQLAEEENTFEYFVSMLMFVSIIIVFIMGTPAFLAVMFYSSDNESVLNLPIKTHQIFLARFTMVYISEFFLTAIFVIPILCTAGAAAIEAELAIGAGYFIGVIFSAFLLPVIPLLLISLIALPLLYIVSFFKRSNVIAGVAMIVGFFAMMAAIYSVVLKFPSFLGESSDLEGQLNALIAQIRTIGTVSYPTLVYSRMILGINAGASFGIFAAILVGCSLLVVLMTAFTFRRGLRLNIESIGGSRKHKKQIKEGRKNTLIVSLFKRELKEVTKNPVLFFQSSMNMIMPLFLMVMFYLMGMFNITMENMQGQQIVMNMEMQSISTLILFGCMMLCGMNYCAMIAISREGSNLAILKSLPITPKQIMRSKLLLADANIFVGDLVFTIAMAIMTKQHILNAIAFFVLILIYGMSINAYSIYRDLKSPKLHWNSLKEITNRNFNLVVPMMLSALVGIVMMFVAMMCASTRRLPVAVRWTIIWSVMAVIDLVLYFILRKRLLENSENLLKNIEC